MDSPNNQSKSHTYDNHTINQDGDLLNLTQIWIANGRPPNKRPVDWLALASTQYFIERLKVSNVGLSHLAPDEPRS
jgi:hypothetical protein